MDSPSTGNEDTPAALAGLDFPALAQAMTHYLQVADPNPTAQYERWGLAIGLMGAAIAMLFGTLLQGTAALVFAVAGLVMEVIGLSLTIILPIKREWRDFRFPYPRHAAAMETDFHHYQAMVAALRAFPLEQRLRRETFMRNLRLNMHERLGLFTGGMEKLGIVPLLLALYLQLKDWRWGDWHALSNIHLAQSLLAFLLLVAYALSWHLTRLRIRVQRYEQLLAEANRQDTAGAAPAPPHATPASNPAPGPAAGAPAATTATQPTAAPAQ